MKILILSIYSDSELYKKMIEIQREHFNNFKNNLKNNDKIQDEIVYYFIQFRKQNNIIEIENDIIYVEGEEKILKITDKTLKCLKYLLNDLGETYDFIIRTNISTIINFKQLFLYLYSIPVTDIYCAGKILKLSNLDYQCGILDRRLFGTIYASGTSIILSQDVALNMCNNIDKIRQDIVDDVSFGIYIKKYLPSALLNLNKYVASFLLMSKKIKISLVNNYIFIRNRSANNEIDRENDINNMKNIIDILNI